MQPDLRTICDELVQLGASKSTPASRKKVDEAIASKWDGVKVAAAKALSQWGDPESVQTLKELFTSVASQPQRSSALSTIARLLTPHLQSSDLDWVCDLFLHKTHGSNGLGFLGILDSFSPHDVLKRLEGQTPGGGKIAHYMDCVISRAQYRIKHNVDNKGRPND
ncbi:MAG: hypothetical protein EPN97_07625 [Alphaproteobacteria bacterium]|nr:MAG: hypothetical protein EPN97_07625 [Alphaproteobacteria bacterium]